MEIWGTLDNYFETGTEGVLWILNPDGHIEGRYDFIELEAGDHLTAYNEKHEIIFDGEIIPDYKAGFRPYSKENPEQGQPAALGCWVHWIQEGWQPNDWARLFMRYKNESHLRAKVIRNKPPLF